ncbi:hypothetical protein [Streptomyces sp. NPDC059874]|uniref:hypothetical protein n=1 Tax=Streptomyces sp. NPDC059874 TaxID=3346983 RepID=UPI00365E28D5
MRRPHVAPLGGRLDLADLLPLLPKLCTKVLGPTGTTCTLVGDRRVDKPFFHHGDLTVTGNPDIEAPFVLTGSLSVEGALNDTDHRKNSSDPSPGDQ